MNKYKTNEFKSLGILSHDQKKEYWDKGVSGSQVYRILNDTVNIFKEKHGEIEAFDPSKVASIKEKMDAGIYHEAGILQEAVDRGFIKEDIKTTNETFISTNYENNSANIDGYIGENINNIDAIIEVKNSTQTEKALVRQYLPQLRYYMWFFNAKRGIFLFRLNGNKLVKIDVERDKEEENLMLDNIQTFQTCVKLGMYDMEVKTKGSSQKIIFNLDEDKAKIVDEVLTIQQKIKELKKVETELQNQIKELVEENTRIITSDFSINKKLNVSEKVDYEAAFNDVSNQLEQFDTAYSRILLLKQYTSKVSKVYFSIKNATKADKLLYLDNLKKVGK